MITPVPAPPYALAATPFSFPALAAHAARTEPGSGREIVLGCFIAAHLAAPLQDRTTLTAEQFRERAEGARGWLAAQPLEQRVRLALQRAMSATGAGNRAAVAAELERLIAAAAAALDPASTRELRALAEGVRSSGTE